MTDGNDNTVKESTETDRYTKTLKKQQKTDRNTNTIKCSRSDVELSMRPSPWSHFYLLI